MANIANTNELKANKTGVSAKLIVRIVSITVVLALWEGIARSGLLYKDVVPTISAILYGIWEVLADPTFFRQAGVTLGEITLSVILGAATGITVGIILGSRPFFAKIFEPLLHYLAPTPKIIFFPLLIMWFGIGEGSKIAMGTISSFFPIVLSVASGMRHINPVYVRVGRSFRATAWQQAMKIYIPAMRDPVVNGLRLAFGVSTIGVLLAETKFAQSGLGFMVTRYYQQFNMPSMYGIVLIIFAFAIFVNWLFGKLIVEETQ